MGSANYQVTEKGKSWTVLHDGKADGEYATKEAAFEAAVAAASNAIKQGHAVRVRAPESSDPDMEPPPGRAGGANIERWGNLPELQPPK